jgi:hypothetical protein
MQPKSTMPEGFVSFIDNPPDGATGQPTNNFTVTGSEGLPGGSTFNVYLIDPSGNTVLPGGGSNIPVPNGAVQPWTAIFSGLSGNTWYTCVAFGRVPPNNTTSVDARSYKTA